MPDRTMTQGDTWPPFKFQLSDETGVLTTLPAAASLTAIFRSGGHIIEGAAQVINPPQVDADGVHQWNCQYLFAAGDTDNLGTYAPALRVVWNATSTPPEVETFISQDRLIINAKPD